MNTATTNALRQGLTPLPTRMQSLPVDDRGYPVPYFVAWIDGKPDHRVMDGSKLPRAVAKKLCWLCGQEMEVLNSFVIGPMCAITRTIGEPPSHWDCACWAAVTCPFLTRPQAKRRAANLPSDAKWEGNGLKRNPGAVAVWQTESFRPFKSAGGVLFNIGEPVQVKWVCEGRDASAAEVRESVDSGIGVLEALAHSQGLEAMRDLTIRRAQLDWLIESTAGVKL